MSLWVASIMMTVTPRECPGKAMAIELVFTTLANILAVFNISKTRDADGNEITPSGEYSNGSIMFVILPQTLILCQR